jgi:arsenate reductase (thioredoxin)
MLKVLFVCVHNSARSQIAEELLRKKTQDSIHVDSAGLEPGTLNPIVVDVLSTLGIDISGKETKNVFDLFRKGASFHYVITVCDTASGERCPIFPGAVKYLHWSFPDPSSIEGSYEEKFMQTVAVKDMIEERIDEFLQQISQQAGKRYTQ